MRERQMLVALNPNSDALLWRRRIGAVMLLPVTVLRGHRLLLARMFSHRSLLRRSHLGRTLIFHHL